DHRPTILLRVGEAREAMHDAGAGHDDAGARAAREITVGLRGVGGGLLVAHADIGNAFLLRGRGDRADRKPDDSEQMGDARLFEAPRNQRGAVDFAHGSLLVTKRSSGTRLRIYGRGGKGVIPSRIPVIRPRACFARRASFETGAWRPPQDEAGPGP